MMWKGVALHTWTLDTTSLVDVLRVARAVGWDAVELRRLDFRRAAEAGQPAEAVLDLVRASGLAVACVGVERGWMFAEGEERRRLLDAFAESCRWARTLGCRTVMSPVDAGRGDAARAVASIREVGEIASRHGVRAALEFNFMAEQFGNLSSLRDALVQANHPGCGLLFDTYHFQRSGGQLGEIEALGRGEIAYVQYSDVPAAATPGQALDRLPPGDGIVPFREIFERLAPLYDGFISYEAPNPAAWAAPAEVVARQALRATQDLMGRPAR